jgi:hypothetical protein
VRDAAKMVRWISRLGPRVRAVLGMVLLLILLLLLYPFQTTIVPAWDLRVVDEMSAPVGAINVTEHWQHYLFESSANEDLRQTAADGRVSFPERTMRASLLRRALARMSRIASESRARLDPAASIVAWGRKDHETTVAVYKSGEPPQSEITVHSLR